MENSRDSPSPSSSLQSSGSLTNELKQGKEYARQLQILLNEPHSSTSQEMREFLVQQIIASFNRAVSIAQQTDAPSLAIARSDSPQSGGGSPRSEDSDPFAEDSRKRKVLPRWTTKAQVSPETGFEGPPGDGYNWRKYGQKDILGATYPRAYYRCALKQQASCPATKQVQRSDDDPTIFEVTYRGFHTCNHHQANNSNLPSSSVHLPPDEPPETTTYPPPPQPPKETLICFKTTNRDPPNTIDFHQHHQQSPPTTNPFSFPASSSPTTTTTSTAATTAIGATTSTSTTNLPIVDHDFAFDEFDFDDPRFFH